MIKGFSFMDTYFILNHIGCGLFQREYLITETTFRYVELIILILSYTYQSRERITFAIINPLAICNVAIFFTQLLSRKKTIS